MQNKLTIGALMLAGVLILGVFMFRDGSGKERSPRTAEAGTATIENGVQYVDITARGGYSPKVVNAKAGVPTVIRMTTENSYDCSTSLVISALGYQKNLKPSGVEEIAVPQDKAQGVLKGTCSMAMYRFEIRFE